MQLPVSTAEGCNEKENIKIKMKISPYQYEISKITSPLVIFHYYMQLQHYIFLYVHVGKSEIYFNEFACLHCKAS